MQLKCDFIIINSVSAEEPEIGIQMLCTDGSETKVHFSRQNGSFNAVSAEPGNVYCTVGVGSENHITGTGNGDRLSDVTPRAVINFALSPATGYRNTLISRDGDISMAADSRANDVIVSRWPTSNPAAADYYPYRNNSSAASATAATATWGTR